MEQQDDEAETTPSWTATRLLPQIPQKERTQSTHQGEIRLQEIVHLYNKNKEQKQGLDAGHGHESLCDFSHFPCVPPKSVVPVAKQAMGVKASAAAVNFILFCWGQRC